jgi:hypothetical protein
MTPARAHGATAGEGPELAIGEIAVQEMLHLATACNLLTAVGGAPQLRRPNLPTSPRAYTSAFELRLVPFSLEAVDQFVFLERPEYIDATSHPATNIEGSALAVSSPRDAFFVRARLRDAG